MIPSPKIENSAINSEMILFFFESLSCHALGDMIAHALDPAHANDALWAALMERLDSREESVAKDWCALETEMIEEQDVDDDSNWINVEVPGPEMKKRIEHLAHALLLPGAAAGVARKRFAQSFGSEKWMSWAKSQLRENGVVVRETHNDATVIYEGLARRLIHRVLESGATEFAPEAAPFAKMHVEAILSDVLHRFAEPAALDDALAACVRPEWESIGFAKDGSLFEQVLEASVALNGQSRALLDGVALRRELCDNAVSTRAAPRAAAGEDKKERIARRV